MRRPLLPVVAFALALLLVPAAAAWAQDETLRPEKKPVEPAASEEPSEEAADAAEEEEEDDEEGATFELPLSAEQGGGTVRGRARELEFVRQDFAAASGDVEIRYQDVELEAQMVEIDLATQEVTAIGEVMLDQGPRRITAQRAVFNLETKTGTFYEATAYVAPDYHFAGAEVAKIGDDVYTVENGTFTSCEGDETPDWSFRLGSARVEIEGYARIKNASLRVKKVPVVYTPYIVWPAKTERTSGFLIPEIGYSERKGAEIGLAYYQVLGRSWDTTFHADVYSEGFVGIGNELRYAPSEGTRGAFLAYAIRDPDATEEAELNEWRWKVDWEHVTDELPWGMRGVVSYHDFSDFEFFRDFERDFDRNTIRTLESHAFATGNWGAHSLNVLVNDQETFLAPATPTTPARTITQSKLPEIEYRLRPTQLGGLPAYLDVLSSLSYLSLDRQRNYNDSYGRFDLFPQITVPLRLASWMSVSLSGGGRFTWYGDSLYTNEELFALPEDERNQILAESRFKGDTLTRAVPFAGAEIVGPSFSKIFEAGSGPFSRYKHVVEPRVTVSWLGDFDEQEAVPNFDEVDDLRRTVRGFGLGSTQSTRWALINRLLAKPRAKENEDGELEEAGSAREILSFELSQEISLDDDQPLQRSSTGESFDEGPLRAVLRFAPSLATNLKAEINWSEVFSNPTSTSFSGGYTFGRGNLGATWYTRYDPETGEAFSDQVRFYGGFQVVPNRLRFDTQVNYDIEQSLLQQQAYALSYTSQCFAVRLEMRDFKAGDRRDTEYFFTLSLKNVGTLLPLTARTSVGP